MPAPPRRTFTYEEARAALPEVRALTEQAVQELEALHEQGDARAIQERVEALVNGWAQQVQSRGIEVKGLWLIDFDSGSGYYCWKWPETRLEFFHSYEEGFGGRMRIQ